MNDLSKGQLRTLLWLRVPPVWQWRQQKGGKKGKSFSELDAWNLQAGAYESLIIRDACAELGIEESVRVHYIERRFVIEV